MHAVDGVLAGFLRGAAAHVGEADHGALGGAAADFDEELVGFDGEGAFVDCGRGLSADAGCGGAAGGNVPST